MAWNGGATEKKKGSRGGRQKRKQNAFGNEELCSDIYCRFPMYARHLCRRCYSITIRKATALKPCTTIGCGHKRFRRTMCQAHYYEFLHANRPTEKQCSVATCQRRCAGGGTRFCPEHDTVYGEGVSKNTKKHLTHAAILRTAIVTKQMLDLLPPEQLVGLSLRAPAV